MIHKSSKISYKIATKYFYGWGKLNMSELSKSHSIKKVENTDLNRSFLKMEILIDITLFNLH